MHIPWFQYDLNTSFSKIQKSFNMCLNFSTKFCEILLILIYWMISPSYFLKMWLWIFSNLKIVFQMWNMVKFWNKSIKIANSMISAWFECTNLKEAFFFTPRTAPKSFWGWWPLFSATMCRKVMIRSAFDAPNRVDDKTYH